MIEKMRMAEVETPRNDASYGLWIKGDGKGGFNSILPRESGLVMRGDIKKYENNTGRRRSKFTCRKK